jgi:DNA invertase Pin-like site-specific DNA recombinase
VSDKIRGQHRDRLAIVYIRQSTLQQVERHQESTRLQYALVDRAFHLGWSRERIVVIDDDLGRSGASIEGRPGFQRLVAEVGIGRVGLVLGVEMSRLARSCRDWHQLLEICALFRTLIADVDGVYDPGVYNDRLLLGLKGTMSEAELHILKARMLEGKRAKARRGELVTPVPLGYVVQHPTGEVTLDPDEQVQETVRLIFRSFERIRTVGGVLRYLARNGIRMPVRSKLRINLGQLEWRQPNRTTLHDVLCNPFYAGVYTFGQRAAADWQHPKPGQQSRGRGKVRTDAEVVIRDHVPAYISWDDYQRNQAQMKANTPRGPGPIRAGQALLSGLVVCGKCGCRMSVAYTNNGRFVRYVCQQDKVSHAGDACQSLVGRPLEALVGGLILDALAPAALQVSLKAASDLEAERKSLDRHWQHRLERARISVGRAQRQYDTVEPENRLVARTLERAWEEALAEVTRLEGEYERFRSEQATGLTEAEVAAISGLADDLPALWLSPTTTQAERQAIIRLLLDRVVIDVIDGSERVRVDCHWAGGHRTSHRLVRPVARMEQCTAFQDLTERATELHHAGHNYEEIAEMLAAEGFHPFRRGGALTSHMVYRLLVKAGVVTPTPRPLPQRIERQPNEWTITDLADHLGMPAPTLYTWIRNGRLRSRTITGCAEGRKLVYADEADIAALKASRTMPPPWHRSTQELNDASPSSTPKL